MRYKVIPFNADMMRGEGTGKAAAQLEQLVNQQAQEGWRYLRLEAIETIVTTPGKPAVPGKNGCLGIGFDPGQPEIRPVQNAAQVYVAVFERQT